MHATERHPQDESMPIQNISTHGCQHLKPFVMAKNQYIAAANSFDNTTRRINNGIFIFNTSSDAFVSLLLLATSGASAFEFFSIQGFDYLVVANYYDDDSYKPNSVIYMYNFTDSTFLPSSYLPTMGAYYPRYFTSGQDSFLAIPYFTSGASVSINSVVFKWCDGQFSTV